MVRVSLLASAALLIAGPATAQQTPPPPSEDGAAVDTPPVNGEEDEEVDQEIVVRGLRERGAVIGDIPPENQLNARDIRAFGASSITELLADLAPQTGSSRGRGSGPPVVLINGRRTSGFQELRDLPPEAIYRVDILPEEVALKYGYRADQRVVNFVLRPRFRSTAARLEGEAATDGGRLGTEIDVTRLMIQENGRTSLNAHAERTGKLKEDERSIILAPGSVDDPRPFRTLIGSRDQLRFGGTYNRTILDDVSATLDARVERVTGESLFGIAPGGLVALDRDTKTDTGRLGFALNGTRDRWRWSADGAYEISRTLTGTDRDEAPLSVRDRARSLNTFGNVNLVATGPLVELPAGRSNITVRLSGDTRDLSSRTVRPELVTETDLGRDRVAASTNLDLPVARRNGPLSALGNLTLNGNAEVEHLSDFGTLWTYGGGLTWSPAERLNLIASFTREEGAPGLEQLGNPVLETPNTRIFDFVTGQTALVTAVTGGNPDLLADSRTVWKLGGTWRPFEKTDLDLRVDYTRSRLNDPVSSFPGPTAAIEAAFPDRFTRDASGNLVRVDLRPVNYDRADRENLRWGFNFQKSLRSRRPTPAQIDQLRRSAGLPATPPAGAGTPSAGEQPRQDAGPVSRGRGRGGGFGGFGGGGPFGGGQGGRLQLSVYHTWNLRDEVQIRPGIPVIDYLSGEAVDGGGGRARHLVELEGGYFNNGLGARVSADWRSATRVAGGPSGDLRFSPRARVNLRLFANLGEQFALVAKHPWLRGTQVRLAVDNIFNTRQRVRDALGNTPINYQPDLLDPLGRNVSISVRKLFLPSPRFFREQQQRRQQQ